ncbi:MAG: phenylalanine--tRNA ligase subunit alpha [Verrucomicrobia bacterium]|nr:MAG: phenylalanine--tRNA ligase subunit alpha [Verrucomicrobiota bacterium]
MESKLQHIHNEALAQIETASNISALEAVRIGTLGRSGSISALSQSMKNVPKADRPRFGKLLNELREAVSSALEKRATALNAEADQALLSNLDVTLPGTQPCIGAIHPLTRLLNRAVQIFHRMGFALAEGPDIETEWHCFDALNTPADHPARNEQDTFYLPDGRLLRTHTSTIQTRVMESQSPPLRVIGPGAAYRRDEVDATHLAQFNQLEGLYVAADVSLADLKGTLSFFFPELFGPGTEIRFRPHFFPFTEPSYEIDIRTEALGDQWMELAGCGMVDPAVFEAINARRGDRAYDPDLVSGFAFGFGLDRLAMNLIGIPDIRMLAENDIRFLSQFC